MAVTFASRQDASEAEALAEIGKAGFAAEAKDYPPNKTEPHRHDYDICLHILGGEFRLNLVDEGFVRSCLPGDRVFVPAGTLHSEEHGRLRMVVGRRAPQPAQGPGSGKEA